MGNGRAMTREPERTRARAGAAVSVPARGNGGVAAPTEPLPLRDWFALLSRSENTRRAYRSDWQMWAAWCAARGLSPLPADPARLADWIAEEALTHAPATLTRRLSAVIYAHQLQGKPSPVDQRVREVLRGIRRNPPVIGRGGRDALLLAELRAVCASLPRDHDGIRDRAILAMGWAVAFRRSEIVQLQVEDVDVQMEGMTALVRRSKTDQEGKGRTVAIRHAQAADDPACPVCAVVDWIMLSGISSGPLFPISDRAVYTIVRSRLHDACIDGAWGAHSLRAGLVTQASLAGVDPLTIADTTGHRNLNQLIGYVRRHGDPFAGRNAASEAGL